MRSVGRKRGAVDVDVDVGIAVDELALSTESVSQHGQSQLLLAN